MAARYEPPQARPSAHQFQKVKGLEFMAIIKSTVRLGKTEDDLYSLDVAADGQRIRLLVDGELQETDNYGGPIWCFSLRHDGLPRAARATARQTRRRRELRVWRRTRRQPRKLRSALGILQVYKARVRDAGTIAWRCGFIDCLGGGAGSNSSIQGVYNSKCPSCKKGPPVRASTYLHLRFQPNFCHAALLSQL